MANQCMVVWEDVSRPPLDLLCLPMSGKCHWEVSRHVRNCCADNCYGWTPGATVYHAIFTVSRIRMLSQSQTMVFRRCAWRLLHSLLTKLSILTSSYRPRSKSLLRLLRKHTHDLQLVFSQGRPYVTLQWVGIHVHQHI